jgi:hypothetical protein
MTGRKYTPMFLLLSRLALLLLSPLLHAILYGVVRRVTPPSTSHRDLRSPAQLYGAVAAPHH